MGKRPLVRKKKERVKKTLTKKPKEKRMEKRKTVRERRKRKETTKFSCLLSPNLVISYYIYQIRHLIIISALKKQEEIDCDSLKKKNTPRKNARNARPILSLHDRTSVIKKNKSKMWMVFFSQRQKKTFALFLVSVFVLLI